MPLSLPTLKVNLRRIMDTEDPYFIGYPASPIQAAENFSNAIGDYALSIAPYSATNQQARLAFKTVLSGMSSELQNGLVLFPLAFASFATSLGLGMTGFAVVPPPIPISFQLVASLGLAGAPASTCSDVMAQLIDIWFRTGIATPPSGSPIIWN